MTLTDLIENHHAAVAVIADYDTASEEAFQAERASAQLLVRHRPASMEEVRQLARHALGEDLTAEDKAELLRTLSA